MNTVLYPICAGTALLALLYRVRALLSVRSPANTGLVGVFLFAFLVWVSVLPWLWSPITRSTGITNFSGLAANVFVIMMVACQQVVLLHLSHPDRRVAWRAVLPRLVAIAAVLVVMITLFSTSVEDQPASYGVVTTAEAPIYFTTYLIAFGLAQLDVARLCWRYASTTGPAAWLRRSLRLLIISVAVAHIYVAGRLGGVIAGLFGSTGYAWEPVALLASMITSNMQMIAWVLPDVGPRVTALWVRINHSRIQRDIAKLHRELTTAVPKVARDLGHDLDTPTRQLRLVIENRDAQRTLSAWMDPAVTDAAIRHAAAARLRGNTFAATVEAAQLRAAIHTKQQNTPIANPNRAPRHANPTDWAAEQIFQQKLARAFQSSPIVDAALTEAAGRMSPTQEPA